MNHRIGLTAILGIWLTAGFALPLVNVLHSFSATQLMFFRGLGTAMFALLVLGGKPTKLNHNTLLLMLVLPLATPGLYQGVRHWGAGPTIILLTATPLINGLIALFQGRRLAWHTLLGFTLVIGGVCLAQQTTTFNLEGLLWSLFATLMNGLLYELFKRSQDSAFQQCFVTASGMALLGLVLSFDDSWVALTGDTLPTLLAFVLAGGLLYWLSNLYAFRNLPTVEGSVLAQGETPAVMFGAWLILGEPLSLQQWSGVTLSILGLTIVLSWLSKAPR